MVYHLNTHLKSIMNLCDKHVTDMDVAKHLIEIYIATLPVGCHAHQWL